MKNKINYRKFQSYYSFNKNELFNDKNLIKEIINNLPKINLTNNYNINNIKEIFESKELFINDSKLKIYYLFH